MSNGMFEGGYMASVADLERLQRTFGPAVTKRKKLPDQMATHNMNATKGCPCDPCRLRDGCLHPCIKFRHWTTHGKPIRRSYHRKDWQ